MSDFKPTPTTDLTTTQLLDRYQMDDEWTIKSWANLHGIDRQQGIFSPDDVDLIDHVHHHIHNLGMSIDEYKNLLNRRFTRSQPPQEVNPPTPQVLSQEQIITQEASQAMETLMAQYSEAIDMMGERIADHFIDELDLSVMRHLARKVKERQALNGQARPNRFLKTIQAVLNPKSSALLVSPPEESSLQMESNHRLG